MAAFEALCEGFLGINAHWKLFWHLFCFTIQSDNSRPTAIGYASLKIKLGMGDVYIVSNLSTSNKGWHSGWFYLKNDPKHPFPKHIERTFYKVPAKWSYSPTKADWKKLDRALRASRS